jgi:tetratricopeptide (TPR) repeat protein
VQPLTHRLLRRPLGALLYCLPFLALLPLGAAAHGAIHEQLQALSVALENAPNDPALLYRQAELLVAHDNRDAALRSLDRVDTLVPGRYPTALLRARLALAAGQPGQTEVILAAHLAAHPDDLTALLLRARAHSALGQHDEARADYREVWHHREAAPDCDLVQEIADALAADAPPEALTVLDAGLQRHGPVPSLLLRALELDLALARYDSALQRVETLRGLSPRPEPWMARRAEILAQAGRAAESHAAWQALAAHLDTLPNLDRGTPAIRRLAERARTALAQPVLAASLSPVSPPHP